MKAEKHSSLILIFGDDDFEVRSKARACFKNWARQSPEVEPECIDGNVSNTREVSELLASVKLNLETFPLFGEGKILWLRSCNFLSAEGRFSQAASVSRELESLLNVLKYVDWQRTKLLISATGVDKRRGFYKWIQKTGKVLICESLSAQGEQGRILASDLIEDQVRKSGKSISRNVTEYLLQCVGLDRRMLVSECEKAILHSGNQDEITHKDVESVVSKSRQARAFAFADAVANRKLSEALSRLDEEIWTMRSDRQRSEMGLLYGLISKFRTMIIVKDLIASGRLREKGNYNSVRTQLAALSQNEFPLDKRFNPKSQNPFVIFRALSQVRHYHQGELIASLSLLMDCNQRLVSVSDNRASMLRDCIISIILGSQQKDQDLHFQK